MSEDWITDAAELNGPLRVLGVPRDADHDTIRRAYRKLAPRYHPDLNTEPGAEESFKQLGETKEVLSDAEKREGYDQLGARWHEAEQDAPDESFEDFFAQQGTATVPAWSSRGICLKLCSVRVPGRAGGPLRGHDREARLELSLAGGRRRLTLEGREIDVNFPAGVRDGQLIRLAGQGGAGRASDE